MSIFNFSDSRAFLRHYISTLPRKGRGESTKIARYLRVSTTLVSQVLNGEKSWTAEQAQALTEYLGLSELETDHFLFMIHYERAGSAELKKYWQSKLNDLKSKALQLSERLKSERVLNDQERSVFYSSALYSAVRLFTSIGKGKTVGEVEERFEISRARASEILHFLVETGLCRLEKDRYIMGAQSTFLEQGSPHLLKHYSNWRIRAIRQSEELSEKELMYTSVVSLAQKDFDLLREGMVGFIKEFLDKVHASPAEEIACFNLDFFWIKR